MKHIRAADLFCGAGGTSMGMGRACRDLGLGLDLLAINHWPIALETHARNHPAATHLCESLDSVDPRKVVKGGKLDLLVASPECTHHSRARGGRPTSDQSRASGWHVPRWLEATRAECFILENVPEWQEWGPIGTNGKPMKSRKGETFKALMGAIESLGYNVEWGTLCAADYGDPTTRERLFVLGRRGVRSPITWPTPSHGKVTRTLFESVQPWKAARSVIDFTTVSASIFSRKRPLAPKTMERIYEGLRRFGGPACEPFLVVLRNHMSGRSLDDPLPTITGGGTHLVPCEPFLLSQASGGAPRAVSDPMPTICADGATALVDASFIVPNFGERHGQAPRTHSLDDPMPAVTSHGAGCLTEPFLTKYDGTGTVADINDPLDTITAKDRFGLCTPLVIRTADGGILGLDIRFRMLQPKELAGGMSFDADYSFAGTKGDQIKQIGNAVPGELSRALCRAQLSAFADIARDRAVA